MFNVVCVSWKIMCLISLMHGVSMKFNAQFLYYITIYILHYNPQHVSST